MMNTAVKNREGSKSFMFPFQKMKGNIIFHSFRPRKPEEWNCARKVPQKLRLARGKLLFNLSKSTALASKGEKKKILTQQGSYVQLNLKRKLPKQQTKK